LKKIIYTIFCTVLIISCTKSKNSPDGISKEESTVFTHDSVKAILLNLESEKYDTVSRKKNLIIANEFYNKKKLDVFYKVSKIIEKKSTSIKDTLGIIYAKSNIGLYYLNRFSNDSSYLYFSKAEKISRQLENKPCLGGILLSKSNILWSQKDFSGAETTAVKALKIAQEKGYHDDVYSCYIVIANSLTGMGKNEKALEYYSKALAKTNYFKDADYQLICRASTRNYIAEIYQKLHQHQKAIDYVTTNVNLEELRKTDLKTYCYLLNTIAYSKFKLNDKSALPQFEEILHIADSTQFTPTQVAVKINLAEYFLAQKDTVRARFYAANAQKAAHQNKIFEDELKTLQFLANTSPDKQSFYNERYIELSDSLQNVERATRDKFARIEFETEEITTQKKAIEQQKKILLQRIWVIVSFGLLLLMVVVLWFKNKSQKARTRELILEQEHQKDKEEIYQLMLNQQQKIEEGKQIEKKRISQELHDGIMGKLSSIRMNLFVLNKKNDPETIAQCLEYVKEIQNIEKEIRIISHDLNKNIFSDSVNFVSIVENLFNAIKSHTEIDFSLKVDERIDWETVDNKTKISIYRIIQEALQNIDKYASPENVSIKMEKKDNAIKIEIQDNGIGFNVNHKKKGIGITNMQARMQEINGKFRIESQLQKGTKIILIIPN
jgi:signal transduction histidine kinase